MKAFAEIAPILSIFGLILIMINFGSASFVVVGYGLIVCASYYLQVHCSERRIDTITAITGFICWGVVSLVNIVGLII